MPIPESADPKDYVACQVRRNGGNTHPMTVHDLFNELQRRLEIESQENLAEKVDELHWKYYTKKEVK